MTTISGIVDNTSVINVNPADDTLTVAAGGASLKGGGQVDMSDSGNNVIQGINDAVLTNVNNTIVGAGALENLTLVNGTNGVIDATFSDNPLYIETGEPTTNKGVMEATAGGVLYFASQTVDNNGGVIRAVGAGSTIDLFQTDIEGGAINTYNGGVVDILAGQGNDIFDGTQSEVTINGEVDLNHSALTLDGAIDNKCVISLTSNNFTSILAIGGSGVTLSGGGRIVLNDSANNVIQGANGSTLTNVDDTIIGAGMIESVEGTGLSLINEAHGVIDAIYANDDLVISTAALATNDGIMEATGGGVLEFAGQTVDNANGTIGAYGAGSTVDLMQSDIQGGLVTTVNGGVIDILAGQSDDAFDGTAEAVDIKGHVALHGSGLTLYGAIDNQGTITLASNNRSAILGIGGAGATLGGGGRIVLSDSANNVIQGANGSTLTNIDDTIVGAGEIESVEGTGLSLVNEAQGVIDAIYANDDLVISTAALATNDGIMEATGGGVLYFSGQTVANANGFIKAGGAGSIVDLFETDIQGGVLQTYGGGVFDVLVGQSNDVFDGTANAVVVEGHVDLNESALTLEGTIDLKGTIALTSPNGAAILYIGSSDATLEGGGTVMLSDSANNHIQATNDPTLTNVDDTIIGAGYFDSVEGTGLTIVNEASGSIIATDLDNDLIFATRETVENNGRIGAMGGYLLSDDNVSGSGYVEIGGGGTANFRGYFDQNAVFDGAGTLQIESNYYSGTVSHMGVGDTVDEYFTKVGTSNFDGFVWNENAQGTGGVLDVDEFVGGFTTTAYALNIAGLYVQDDFTVGSDSANDIIISCVRDDTLGWKYAKDGNWTSATNWTRSSVPNSGADVVIDIAGTYRVTDTQNTTSVANFYMSDFNATLLIGAGDTFALSNGGVAHISGLVETSAGSTLDIDGGAYLGVVAGYGGVLHVGGAGALVDFDGAYLQAGTTDILSGAKGVATGAASNILFEDINVAGTLQANVDLTLYDDSVDAAGGSLVANGAILYLENTGIGGGTLTAMNGGAFVSDIDGVTLNGVTIAAATSLTIDHGGTFSGSMVNKGTVEVQGDTLLVEGSLSGAGALEVDAVATLQLDGSVTAYQTITLKDYSSLSLGALTSFAGALSGFNQYVSLDLVGLDANASLVSYNGNSASGVLTIADDGANYHLKFLGGYGLGNFSLKASSDGESLVYS